MFIASLGSKPGRINCDRAQLEIYFRVHLLIFLFFTLDNGDLRQSGTTFSRCCLVSVGMHVRVTLLIKKPAKIVQCSAFRANIRDYGN